MNAIERVLVATGVLVVLGGVLVPVLLLIVHLFAEVPA